MYLGLLLCTSGLGTQHLGEYSSLFFLAAAETLLTGLNGMGSRNQLKVIRTHGFESSLLSHQPLTDLFGKAVPLQAAVSSIKEAVSHPRTLTAVDVQRLGGCRAPV